MPGHATPATPAPIATLRTFAGALTSAVVMFGVVAFLVLDSREHPPVWLAAGLGVLALRAHGAAEVLGNRAPAVSPTGPPEAARAAGRTAYQSAMMLRFGAPALPRARPAGTP
jgi:hypothetical protein